MLSTSLLLLCLIALRINQTNKSINRSMNQLHQSIDHLDSSHQLVQNSPSEIPNRPNFFPPISPSRRRRPFVETRLLDYSPECPDGRRPFALGCKLAAFPCRLPSQKPLILCYPAEAERGVDVDGHSGNSGRKEAGSVQDSGYTSTIHSFNSSHVRARTQSPQ